LAPEVTQQISAAVRERLSVPDCADAAAIIIVDDFRIRRYLRRLIELEFPSTPVYSRSDLNPSIPLQALGQIRVAGGLKE
jgi:type III secretory pathway component EscV